MTRTFRTLCVGLIALMSSGCMGAYYGDKGHQPITDKDVAKIQLIFQLQATCHDGRVTQPHAIRVRDIQSLCYTEAGHIRLVLMDETRRRIQTSCDEVTALTVSSGQYETVDGAKHYPKLAVGSTFGTYPIIDGSRATAIVRHLVAHYHTSVSQNRPAICRDTPQ